MEIIGNIIDLLAVLAFLFYAGWGMAEFIRKQRAARRKLEAETRMADEIGRQIASGNASISNHKHGHDE